MYEGEDVEFYDVLAEGQLVAERRQGVILWGATANSKEKLPVAVEDGYLDISFDPRARSPHVAAIEIEAEK
jgi:hypothetical protein